MISFKKVLGHFRRFPAIVQEDRSGPIPRKKKAFSDTAIWVYAEEANKKREAKVFKDGKKWRTK